MLDVGCGEGEFLIQVLERHPVNGIGVDASESCIKVANSAASSRLPTEQYEFQNIDAISISLEVESVDVAICIGSTHAFGEGQEAYPKALKQLSQYVKPGGQLLIGEGFWQKDPDPEYLALLGEPVGIYNSHQENVEVGQSLNLFPLYAVTSSLDEWDDFEWHFSMSTEKEAADNGHRDSIHSRLLEARKWRDGYLKWGRSTMGFGFYLFQKAI